MQVKQYRAVLDPSNPSIWEDVFDIQTVLYQQTIANRYIHNRNTRITKEIAKASKLYSK